jgi:hypothetical protein
MDADSLMQPKDGPYKIERVPSFWEFIEAKAAAGIIASSVFVYREICDAYQGDPLRIWAEARAGTPLFREPSDDVQCCMNEVADYVNGNYEPEQAQLFLAKADPWLIAHAKADGGTVVTFEALVGPGAKIVKIPNVCRALGLGDPINTYQMLDALDWHA